MRCTHYTHTVMYVISVSIEQEKGKERKDKKSRGASIRCFRGSQKAKTAQESSICMFLSNKYSCYSANKKMSE